MPREKLYDRKTDLRTAQVFVIACEGEHTEAIYFEALAEGLRRVKVIPLPTFEGLSAPEKVIERLNEFAAKQGLSTSKETGGDSELWMTIDVDRWFAENRLHLTHKVLSEAERRGYEVAISDRCFEVWLLYHFETVEQHGSIEELENRLRTHLGGYSKRRLDFEKYRPHVETAMQRAREADLAPEERRPRHPGSRIYRLLDAMKNVCGVSWAY